jgi:hypothetical protein
MEKHNVTLFKPYPFSPGQKIHISGGPRSGDWLVVDITDKKVKLQCPVSLKEFQWDRFCYFVEALTETQWPKKE